RACFVILLKNLDLWSWKATMRQLEDRFNRNYGYPYVFLNNEEFDQTFMSHVRNLTNATVHFGRVPAEHWSIPDFIDRNKAQQSWERMKAENVIYGGSESYRHMCRFESGFFYRHPLLQDFDYYWRVEPDVEFFCDVHEDPFARMARSGAKYGFTISLKEYTSTIPTLWNTTKGFIEHHNTQFPNDTIPQSTQMRRFLSPGGLLDEYSLCHFWSNFEIGDLRWFRSEEYGRWFDWVDKAGGFFYERWGDAPIHSIAVMLFLKPEDVIFFEDIGYRHIPFTYCPRDLE
ncbi:glycosyltransferase family 15 protein, partial [Gonapodya prolifera JEL478]